MRREDARVLVVGVGGLGCPAALALARAGVGTIGIADDDEVDLTNLHRQILFDEADVGRPKVDAARAALARLVPGVRTEAVGSRLLPENAVDLVTDWDVVVEGSDNFPTKFLTADACAIAAVPVVQAAAVRWHGTALAVGRRGRPCYRCLFEDIPHEHAPNCAEAGVMGPVVGVVAALQIDLVLGFLDGREVAGTLVTFDGKSERVRRRRASWRASCPLCGETKSITRIDRARYLPPDAAGACVA